MRPFLRKASLLALTAVLATACQDLDVVNTNAPDRERALNNPSDVLTLMTSAYGGVHGRTFTSSSSYLAFPTIADEGTATYANAASLEMSSEPRVPFNNNPSSTAHDLARYQWEDWYGVIADVNDVLGAINNGLELTITDSNGDDVNYDEESQLWGKLLQGWAHSYLGALIDQAYVYTENDLDKGVADLELQPYPEVLAAGHQLLHDAIDYAGAHPNVVIPSGWMGPMPDLPAADIAKIGHIIAARMMVFGARTPEERAAVDWDHVIQHLDKTFTSDLIMPMDNSSRHTGLYYWLNSGTFIIHCDYKNCGPADTSGEYQKWLATPFADRMPFDIVTPDQRYPQLPLETYKESPTGYFEYDDRPLFRPERGTYHASHYKFVRYPDYRRFDYSYFKRSEVDLLRAEALYHKGDLAGAATLVNKTRVANGGLPPMTASGVPGTPGNCVPMMSTTTAQCGDFLQGLMYERRMELLMQDALYGYLDSRGFGRLSEGTFIHLPIPGRELATLGMELYSFGGVGGPGSANNVR